MALTLYLHPLASYCWKVLIALYEHGTAFEAKVVNLGDAEERAAFKKIWPIGKFPVLHDEAANRIVGESTSIIEYLEIAHPGRIELVPKTPFEAHEVRYRDRFFDLHVHEHMQKIVGDKLRSELKRDSHGVGLAIEALDTAYGILDRDFMTRTWAAGEAFTMADCAAAPALYYANLVQPFFDAYPNLASYMRRLYERPSFVRVLGEAEPYFSMFPG